MATVNHNFMDIPCNLMDIHRPVWTFIEKYGYSRRKIHWINGIPWLWISTSKIRGCGYPYIWISTINLWISVSFHGFSLKSYGIRAGKSIGPWISIDINSCAFFDQGCFLTVKSPKILIHSHQAEYRTLMSISADINDCMDTKRSSDTEWGYHHQDCQGFFV